MSLVNKNVWFKKNNHLMFYLPFCDMFSSSWFHLSINNYNCTQTIFMINLTCNDLIGVVDENPLKHFYCNVINL